MAGINKGGTGGAKSIGTVGSEAGWQQALPEFTRRTVFMDIIGASGTGRTSLALTAPGPVAVINADEKVDGVVQPHVRAGKDIRVATFGFVAGHAAKQDIAVRAGIVWDRVCGWLDDSTKWAKTTVFDTGTEGWELIRLARFGEMNPKGNRMDALYGPVNAEFRSTFKRFRQQEYTNLITLHQVKDEYQDKVRDGKPVSVRTGREVRAGFKEMQYMADVVIRTGRGMNGVFTATVEKGWFNAATEGLTFEGPPSIDEPMSCHFANIMALITETEASEWV
jgi:hypothetical protein